MDYIKQLTKLKYLLDEDLELLIIIKKRERTPKYIFILKN